MEKNAATEFARNDIFSVWSKSVIFQYDAIHFSSKFYRMQSGRQFIGAGVETACDLPSARAGTREIEAHDCSER